MRIGLIASQNFSRLFWVASNDIFILNKVHYFSTIDIGEAGMMLVQQNGWFLLQTPLFWDLRKQIEMFQTRSAGEFQFGSSELLGWKQFWMGSW